MKTLEILNKVAKTLKAAQVESAEKEAEVIVRQGLGIDTSEMYANNPALSDDRINAIEELLQRRLGREPLQYILGSEEFLGLKLIIGRGVLIPRPETELMAEHAIKTVKSYELRVKRQGTKAQRGKGTEKPSTLAVLDLCTGSGCLALALAREFLEAEVYGTDISNTAIAYAIKNAEINNIKNAVFLKGSLFEPLKKLFTVHCSLFTVDLIISNPPYIRTGDIKTLQPEVKDWEPEMALDGGADGLDFYRELIPASGRFLKNNGIIMLESGAGQAADVADMLKASGYEEIEITKDYAGIERIIQATWKN
ncbi:MAG: peptide chain release factor N(5)-glutamine methyltransferase [Nitrospirae bacterium]|nr:peptide chain release factor N(5)-glutamine methyltransferase [Nitrospirota bacterium]